MEKLPLPQQERKQITFWKQLQLGLLAYMVGLAMSDFTNLPIYEVVGIWIYAGVFGINPILPDHLKDDPEKAKKYRLSLRILALVMIIMSTSKLVPMEG